MDGCEDIAVWSLLVRTKNLNMAEQITIANMAIGGWWQECILKLRNKNKL